MKTSWRRLKTNGEDKFFRRYSSSSRRLEEVFKMSLKHYVWEGEDGRRLQDIFKFYQDECLLGLSFSSVRFWWFWHFLVIPLWTLFLSTPQMFDEFLHLFILAYIFGFIKWNMYFQNLFKNFHSPNTFQFLWASVLAELIY